MMPAVIPLIWERLPAMNEDILTALNTIGIKRREAMFGAPLRMKLSDLAFYNLTFAQCGEDIAISRFFKGKIRNREPGFYVDVGCFDPRLGSNTYLFNCYGWRGICIDANPRFADDYKHIRPQDIFVHGAVGAGQERVFFAQHLENQGASKVGETADFGPGFAPAITVPTVALRDVFRQHLPRGTAIDFMTLDLEGAEMDALESNDWDEFPATLVMMEAHGIDRSNPTTYPTVAYLMTRGYEFSTFMGHNAVMYRRT